MEGYNLFTDQHMLQVMQQSVDYDKMVYDNCANIRTGDIIASRGSNFIGGAIRYITKAPVDHVGIVIRVDGTDKEHVMVAEATPHGVRIHPYNYYYIQSSCMVGRVFTELGKDQRDGLRQESLRYLGVPYEWSLYPVIVWHLLTIGRHVPENDISEDTRKFICSEYVPLIYYRALKVKLVNKAFKYTTPGDIVLSPKIKWVKMLDGSWDWDVLDY